MTQGFRPLLIRGNDKVLSGLRDDYQHRMGYECTLTHGKLIVHPRWNSANLEKNGSK